MFATTFLPSLIFYRYLYHEHLPQRAPGVKVMLNKAPVLVDSTSVITILVYLD
jgi:hypothetical protein